MLLLSSISYVEINRSIDGATSHLISPPSVSPISSCQVTSCVTLYVDCRCSILLKSVTILWAIKTCTLFTVRCYALHGLSYRNSVCLSICHTRGLCSYDSTYDHDFFTAWQPRHSSFWGYHVHAKILTGHPERGRWTRVGWVRIGDFRTNKPPYLWNGARYAKVTIDH